LLFPSRVLRVDATPRSGKRQSWRRRWHTCRCFLCSPSFARKLFSPASVRNSKFLWLWRASLTSCCPSSRPRVRRNALKRGQRSRKREGEKQRKTGSTFPCIARQERSASQSSSTSIAVPALLDGGRGRPFLRSFPDEKGRQPSPVTHTPYSPTEDGRFRHFWEGHHQQRASVRREN
jgi:hypothetical protein